MLVPSQFRFLSHLLPISQARRVRSQSYRRNFTMVPDNWQRIEKHKTSVPPYTLFTKPIEKSQLDDREYRLIKLENGLLAMLIHDATADIAAASLDVAVGHLSDPVGAFLFGVIESEVFANWLHSHRMTSRALLTSANTCYSWYEPFPVTSTTLKITPYRAQNNFRKRTSTPKCVSTDYPTKFN